MEGLMKGIFNVTLALTGQFAVWDPDIVLDYLINLEYDLPLKDLSEKLAILLCLLSEQRYRTVKTLNIKEMYILYQETNENHKPRFLSFSYCVL